MTTIGNVIGHTVGRASNLTVGKMKAKSTGWFTSSESYEPGDTQATPEPLIESHVDGGLIRVKWKDLQLTENGDWDFSVIDTQIAIHVANNKPFNLLVADSWNMPAWVVTGSTTTFNFDFPPAAPETRTVPVIWDSYYQTHKGNLVAELGRVYDSHPLLRTIYFTYAAMSNGGEFHWRVTQVDYENSVGYSDAVHRQAAEDIFDMYSAAFPTTHIAIEAHVVFGAVTKLEQLYDYAFAQVGTQVGIAMWWLASRISTNNSGVESEADIWTIALRAKGQGSFLIGQTVGNFTDRADRFDYVNPPVGPTDWQSTPEVAFVFEMEFYKSGAVDATYNPYGIIIDCIESWPKDVNNAALVALYDYPRG